MLNVTTYTTVFFQNLIIFTLFKYWFSPHYYYLLITNYIYKGYFFPEKKVTIHDRQKRHKGKKKKKKKLPQKYCQTWCNKVRCHCPKSCLSVYATCKSSIPNLGTHQGFFSFLVQKIIGSRDLAVFFFLKKKIQSLSNTVFSYIYLKLPHYFRIDTITVWGEACGGKRGRRGDSLFRNKMFVFDGIVQRNFKTLLYFNYIF